LIDATHFVASRQLSASVDAQVAYADVLLVTKAALIGNSDHPDRNAAVGRAEAVARTLAPRALVRRGTADDHAAWLEALLADPLVERAETPGEPHPAPQGSQPGHAHDPQPNGQVSDHVHTADCRHLDSSAAHGIDSVWVPVGSAVDLEELEDQLAELPANYVRIKGILQARGLEGAPRWFAVHRVGPRVSSEPIEPQEAQQARIVALGPGVAANELARCVAVAAA
jgi:G3E family GTPase